MSEVKYKFPKALAACADKYYQLKEQKAAAQKLVDAIDAEGKALKEHLINTLPKSEASGVAGKLARVTVVTKPVPQVKDWEKFYKYVKKTDQFELLQRRLSDAAVKERWDAGKQVPGVESFNVVTLSVNKI
jgi:hypothetical protein